MGLSAHQGGCAVWGSGCGQGQWGKGGCQLPPCANTCRQLNVLSGVACVPAPTPSPPTPPSHPTPRPPYSSLMLIAMTHLSGSSVSLKHPPTHIPFAVAPSPPPPPFPANDRQLKFFERRLGRVFLHPSSACFSAGSFPSGWLVYSQLVETGKAYVREASMAPVYGLLMCGGEKGGGGCAARARGREVAEGLCAPPP
jgi:hypothetical protein